MSSPRYLFIIAYGSGIPGYSLNAEFFEEFYPNSKEELSQTFLVTVEVTDPRIYKIFHSVLELKTLNLATYEYECCKLCERYSFRGIVGWNEYEILLCARLRERYQIQGQTSGEALLFRDKIEMKKALQDTITVPKFGTAEGPIEIMEFAKGVGYPLIIKPIAGLMALGVFKLESESDLVKPGLFSHYGHTIDVEEFVDGSMFAVGGLYMDGEILYSWPAKYVYPLLDTIIENRPRSVHLLSSKSPQFFELQMFAKKTLDAMKPNHSLFHIECFYKNGEFIFCEIGSRWPGGFFPHIWKHSFGFSLLEESFQLQIGGPTKKRDLELETITGFVICPAGEGVLQPYQTDFPEGVFHIETLAEVGRNYTKGNNVMSAILYGLIQALTEDSWQAIATQFIEYFNTHFKFISK